MYATANNLTLTNVVFESNRASAIAKVSMDLTLTNVVFELKRSKARINSTIFNFNKCCI